MSTVRVRGSTELQRQLAALPPEYRRRVATEIMRSAVNIQTGAKQRCPVKTGRLRNSIAVQTEEGGLSARVGSNVKYAPHVEFGTRKMAARPFLFPAFQAEAPKFRERLTRVLNDAAKVVR